MLMIVSPQILGNTFTLLDCLDLEKQERVFYHGFWINIGKNKTGNTVLSPGWAKSNSNAKQYLMQSNANAKQC